MLSQPVRHTRIAQLPRLLKRLVVLPHALIAIEELKPVALVLGDDVAFQAVLVPVVVLLTVAVPLLCLVNHRHGTEPSGGVIAARRAALSS